MKAGLCRGPGCGVRPQVPGREEVADLAQCRGISADVDQHITVSGRPRVRAAMLYAIERDHQPAYQTPHVWYFRA